MMNVGYLAFKIMERGELALTTMDFALEIITNGCLVSRIMDAVGYHRKHDRFFSIGNHGTWLSCIANRRICDYANHANH